jgi:hypothetical protein
LKEQDEDKDKEKGAVLMKDNVVWSSTESGFPLCTFRSFGTFSRSDGTIAIDLTSSAEDEAFEFKSSAELQASLLATLDWYAAAIGRKKKTILNGGMYPEAAFTLTPAPAPAPQHYQVLLQQLQSRKKP